MFRSQKLPIETVLITNYVFGIEILLHKVVKKTMTKIEFDSEFWIFLFRIGSIFECKNNSKFEIL